MRIIRTKNMEEKWKYTSKRNIYFYLLVCMGPCVLGGLIFLIGSGIDPETFTFTAYFKGFIVLFIVGIMLFFLIYHYNLRYRTNTQSLTIHFPNVKFSRFENRSPRWNKLFHNAIHKIEHNLNVN